MPTPESQPAAEHRRWSYPALSFLGVLLVAAYLAWLLLTAPRGDHEYTYQHVLFDYHFGPTRRALEGELLRHLVSPPYSLAQFRAWSGVPPLIAAGLFLVICVALVRRGRAGGWLLLAAVIVTSPLTFKNALFDQGRQDIFGLIALEITFLLCLRPTFASARWFVSLAIVPLSLINENQLLLYLPACLVLLAFKAEWSHRALAWPLGLFAFGFALNLALPRPAIPATAYRAYLEQKSLDPLSTAYPAHVWLYTDVRENLAFAAAQARRFGAEHWRHLPDYGVFLAINAAVASLTFAAARAHDRRAATRYLAGCVALVPFYALLFGIGCDWARWFANGATCLFIVTLFAVDFFRLQLRGCYWLLPVVLLQLNVRSGFGVVTPQVDLVRGVRGLLSTPPATPGATAR